MSMRHEVSKLVAVSSYATTSARSRDQALSQAPSPRDQRAWERG